MFENSYNVLIVLFPLPQLVPDSFPPPYPTQHHVLSFKKKKELNRMQTPKLWVLFVLTIYFWAQSLPLEYGFMYVVFIHWGKLTAAINSKKELLG